MAGYRRPGTGRIGVSIVKLAIIGASALAVIVIAVVLVLKLGGGAKSDAVALPSLAPVATAESATPAPSAEISAEPTQTPAATPAPANDTFMVVNPTPLADGFLPIFSHAETKDKIIAITVDDFYQFTNARTIIDVALDNDSLLTIFPIGKNVVRDELKDTIRYAYDNGIEIENHTFDHVQLCRLDDTKMAKQIFLQNMAVDYALNLEYQEHFFRPMGGDGRFDQRTHLYAQKLGMRGIAHWNVSGSGTDIDKLIDGLAPGNIYLFHTTDSDTEKLKTFIPAAVAAGYRLVTLNQMFGFPANEVSELQTPVKEHVMPEMGQYTLAPYTYKKGDYIWGVFLVQQRLKELGYLSDEPDGVFGQGTYKAVGYFQKTNGIKATGEADPDTQEVLFSDAAIKYKG